MAKTKQTVSITPFNDEEVITEVSQLIAEETLTSTEIEAKISPEPVIEVVAQKAPSNNAIQLAPVERNPSAWNIKEEDGQLNFYSPTGRILKNITTADFNKLMKQ